MKGSHANHNQAIPYAGVEVSQIYDNHWHRHIKIGMCNYSGE